METATKSGYKMTEVGLIPKDWEEVKLNEIGKFNKGSGVKKDDARSGELPCIRYGEIYTFHHYFIREFNSYISQSIASGAKQLKRGDLLFAGSGETKEEIGKCVAFLFNIEAFAGGDIVILSPTSANSLFLGYLLNSTSINKQKANRGQGDAVVHISASQLGEIKIPLPPLPEQTAIASTLKDTDDLINSLENLIAKKKLIKQGAMQELLKPKDGWVKKKLGEVAMINMGQSPLSEYYNQNGIGLPLIQGNADIFNRKTIIRTFTSNITKRGKKGEIIMSVRAPVGEISIAEFECCLGRGVCSINYKNDYLYHYLIYFEKSWSKLSTGSTFDSVNSNQIKELEIPIPVSEEEQIRIAKILSELDIEIEKEEIKLSKLQSIKQGMMQQLLTGKIRLV